MSEFDLVSSGNAGNWLSGFLLLWCVFWCQRRDPGKVLPSLLGKGKQRFTSEKVKVPCEVFDLQASTQEAICETEPDCHQDCADLEGECVLEKGKDGHDTDGSLSLGKGKASGRVDVPSVSTRFSALRSSAGLNSLSPSLPLALAS